MARYFVYCEKHGNIGGYYDTPNEASRYRRKHLINVPRPHGKVDVIEEYDINKYGKKQTMLRKYKT